jgi:hypothetical protein
MSEEDYGLGLPRGVRGYIKTTDRRVRHLDCGLQTVSCRVRGWRTWDVCERARAGSSSLQCVMVGEVPGSIDAPKSGHSDGFHTEFRHLDCSDRGV